VQFQVRDIITAIARWLNSSNTTASPPRPRISQLNRSFRFLNSFLANPPFGFPWEKDQKAVIKERQELGFAGRFGAGAAY
jgi:hypothetical protein